MASRLALPIVPRPRATGAWAFMADPSTGNIALYDEPSAAGAANDPNSARNAPLNNPAANLASLYWHIQLDNMEVLSDAVASVSHGTVAVAAAGPGNIAGTSIYDYSYTPVETVIATHSLGYLPMAYVAVGDDLITPGYIVQMNASGAARYVSAYVTTTQVILREWAQRGSLALGALAQDYRVLVIRQQPAANGNHRLIDWNESTGVLVMGEGRFDSSRRYLQVVPGGTPFGLALGRTLDLANGAVRFVAPDGTTYDPVPADTKLRFTNSSGLVTPLGDSMAYNGTFTGEPVIEVQAP